uniref:Complex 1 LYR protein domain-containing protein n=1 Tax=Romanomermis culicivorax TaxID=13658 RepID=A0A915K6V3_ROMCU
MRFSLISGENLRANVLKLYKEVFRAAVKWESVKPGEAEHEKTFIKGEARRLFKQNKTLKKKEDIEMKLKEGRARLEIGLHYKNPYPRPVYAPPQTLAGIDENKKKLYREKLKRDGKPIYIDSIRDE